MCLFVLLGGGAYAASALPKNSVGAKQIKKNAVRGSKIKAGAVASSDVKDASLLSKDFKPGQLPKGDKGGKGDKGDDGAPGATNVTVRTGTSGGFFATAMCLPGERATGGGINPNTGGTPLLSVPMTGGTDSTDGQAPSGWRGQSTVNGPTVYVICASP
jgi:hypothetical protein